MADFVLGGFGPMGDLVLGDYILWDFILGDLVRERSMYIRSKSFFIDKHFVSCAMHASFIAFANLESKAFIKLFENA